MPIPDLNLVAITDPAAWPVVGQLLTLIEPRSAENQARRAATQPVPDAHARRKAGARTPAIKPSTAPAPPPDHAAQQARRRPKPRQNGRKLGILLPTRTHRCVVEAALLPPDPIRSGTTEVSVHHLIVQPASIQVVPEVCYVPRTPDTSTARLPDGYQGEFGRHIQAVTLTLGQRANGSQPSRLTVLPDVGIASGAGTIARALRD